MQVGTHFPGMHLFRPGALRSESSTNRGWFSTTASSCEKLAELNFNLVHTSFYYFLSAYFAMFHHIARSCALRSVGWWVGPCEPKIPIILNERQKLYSRKLANENTLPNWYNVFSTSPPRAMGLATFSPRKSQTFSHKPVSRR